MGFNDPSSSDDIIDSRDIIRRIEELTDEDERDEFEDDELAGLVAFAEQGEGVSDWDSGATLINDSHFEDYAREYAEGIGAMPDSSAWPGYYIDWEAAARALQMDYTVIEFEGVSFYVSG